MDETGAVRTQSVPNDSDSPSAANDTVPCVYDRPTVPKLEVVKTADRSVARRRIGLTWLDQLAIFAFAELGEGERQKLAALVNDSASALAGPDREEARVRVLSRACAKCAATVDFLTARLGASTTEKQVITFDRLLTSATKRLTELLAEHRAATAVNRTPVIAVAHAEAVHIKGGQ